VCNPSGAWNGMHYVVAWDVHKSGGRGENDFDAVFLRYVTKDGTATGEMIPVAGKRGSPARHASVASDGRGVTLVAYESHPKTADLPIRIEFRVFGDLTELATDKRNTGRED